MDIFWPKSLSLLDQKYYGVDVAMSIAYLLLQERQCRKKADDFLKNLILEF